MYTLKRHIFMMSLDVLQTESNEVNAVVYLTFLTIPLVQPAHSLRPLQSWIESGVWASLCIRDVSTERSVS